jgi:predicted nucleic-acid-binding Zn-ribbon protein
MKCEMCGKEITSLKVGVFNYDGSDSDVTYSFDECENDAVVIDVDPNWTGNELNEDEVINTIHCPHCGKFPFENKEIQTRTHIAVAMFRKLENVDKYKTCKNCVHYIICEQYREFANLPKERLLNNWCSEFTDKNRYERRS